MIKKATTISDNRIMGVICTAQRAPSKAAFAHSINAQLANRREKTEIVLNYPNDELPGVIPAHPSFFSEFMSDEQA